MNQTAREIATRIDTLSDLTTLMRQEKENGVSEKTLRASGILSCEVAASGLRQRGYEVEVFGPQGAKRLRLIAAPVVGAKRRKKDQLSIFDEAA